jgi:hypothetical protein
MRRLTRSILVLSVVVALNAPVVNARVINDDGDPRQRAVPRIVQVIKQIIKFFWEPCDDGGQIIPPNPTPTPTP